MNELFPQIIDKYRTQFQPSKKIPIFNSILMENNISANRRSDQVTDCVGDIDSEHISVNIDNLVPSKTIVRIHATCRRKKPRVEQVKEKINHTCKNSNVVSIKNLHLTKASSFKPKGTKTLTCGFCGDPSHLIRRFGNKKYVGTVQDGSVLSHYLLNNAPFSLLKESGSRKLIITNVSARRGVKQMIVHSLHMKWQCDPNTRPRQNKLAARITFLNQVGEALGGYGR